MQFDLTAKKFSLTNARFCAALAKAIYCAVYDNPSPRRAPGDRALTCIVDAPTDTHAVVQAIDNVIFVVFRGSHSLQNWLTDFDALRENTTGGWLHKGFDDAAQSVLPQIVSVIQGFDPHFPIIVTGHSLGASLALINGDALAQRFPGRVHSIYAFEPAKVGGKYYAQCFNASVGEKTFCITHGADIVPWVPLGFGYKRVGTEIFFPAGRTGWAVNPTWLQKLWSDKWEFLTEFARLYAQRFTPTAFLTSNPVLADHPVDAVIARLDAAQLAVADGAINDWGRSGK